MTRPPHTTLNDPVRARAAAVPDWPGLVLLRDDGGREVITAAELWADIARAAGGLRRAGIRTDDVVMVMLDHSRELIAVFLGAMAIGAVPTIVATATARVDAQLYRQRIETLVRNAEAVAVIVAAAAEQHVLGLPCRIIRSDTLVDADGDDVAPSCPAIGSPSSSTRAGRAACRRASRTPTPGCCATSSRSGWDCRWRPTT